MVGEYKTWSIFRSVVRPRKMYGDAMSSLACVNLSISNMTTIYKTSLNIVPPPQPLKDLLKNDSIGSSVLRRDMHF